MADPDRQSAFSLMSAFNTIGSLVKRQNTSAEKFDASQAYEVKETSYEAEVVQFYHNVFNDMGIGELSVKEDWTLFLRFTGKSLLDDIALFANLRLLPSQSIDKIRAFNRFVGQEFFRVSEEDIVAQQKGRPGKNTNAYFDKFQKAVSKFAKSFKIKSPDKIKWPDTFPTGPDRSTFILSLKQWKSFFQELPGIKSATHFFSPNSGLDDYTQVFNDFFHIQRQFDSPNWKEFDEEKVPYPQPIPRIIAYRNAIFDLNTEFLENEGNISMCYDYCRMKKSVIVSYVRSAEDTFLKIVNRLDEDYPIDVDYAHKELHERCKDLKHMLFPLRCLFFEELDEERGVNESNDNTLDSYFEMSLGNTFVSIPEYYQHLFTLEELDDEVKGVLEKMLLESGREMESFQEEGKLSLVKIIGYIQTAGLEFHEKNEPIYAEISTGFEEKYKADENNISRRATRLIWLFCASMSKINTIRDACQSRLEAVENLSKKYMERAAFLENIDLDEEENHLKLKDDQLPLIAPPDQMEDLFNTQKVVSRLAEDNCEFGDQAKRIEEGLRSAMAMLKKSEQFLQRLVAKIFPNDFDRIDLLEAISKLISLSYKTQQALADATKRALVAKKKGKKDSKKVKEQLAKEAEEIKALKGQVSDTQITLKNILTEKRALVDKMRITKDEKDGYQKRLRMITVMTIQSIDCQSAVQESARQIAS